MSTTRIPRIGIDIGRVIIDGSSHPHGGDTAFFQGDEETMLATPEMPEAFAAIGRLWGLFDGQVWLVSKCGPRVQARTERWLTAHRFSERTSVPRTNVRFCRERPDKRIHCVELGLTHFVDDRADVHQAIRGAVEHQFFFGPQKRRVPTYGVHVRDWTEAERAIEASLTSGSRVHVRQRLGLGDSGARQRRCPANRRPESRSPASTNGSALPRAAGRRGGPR